MSQYATRALRRGRASTANATADGAAARARAMARRKPRDDDDDDDARAASDDDDARRDGITRARVTVRDDERARGRDEREKTRGTSATGRGDGSATTSAKSSEAEEMDIVREMIDISVGEARGRGDERAKGGAALVGTRERRRGSWCQTNDATFERALARCDLPSALTRHPTIFFKRADLIQLAADWTEIRARASSEGKGGVPASATRVHVVITPLRLIR